MAWTREEVEATVASYLAMLALELSGQRYSKTEFRQRLHAQMPARTEAAIEFKHGNISAALIELGLTPIRGYQPRGNFQRLLLEVISAQVSASSTLQGLMRAAVDAPAPQSAAVDFASAMSAAPLLRPRATSDQSAQSRRIVKFDYLEREARNRALGFAGEAFVVDYERWRLRERGAPELAKRVEHVAQTIGDGLGYDVLSYEVDGSELYIEVKTTASSRETPFFVTCRELARSRETPTQYRLYRVYDFRRSPALFELTGDLAAHCNLDPISYRASFGSDRET